MAFIKDHKLFEDFFDELDDTMVDDVIADDVLTDEDFVGSTDKRKFFEIKFNGIEMHFRDSVEKLDDFIDRLKQVQDDLYIILDNFAFISNPDISFRFCYYYNYGEFEKNGVKIWHNPDGFREEKFFKKQLKSVILCLAVDIEMCKPSQVLEFLKIISVYIQRRFQHRFSKKVNFWGIDFMKELGSKSFTGYHTTSVKRVVDIFRKNESKPIIEHMKKLQRILMNGNKDYSYINEYFNSKQEYELDGDCYKIMNILNIPKEAYVYKDDGVLFIEIPKNVVWKAVTYYLDTKYFKTSLYKKYKVLITVNGEVKLTLWGGANRGCDLNKLFDMIANTVNKMTIFTQFYNSPYLGIYDNPSSYTINLLKFFINELVVRDIITSFIDKENYRKPILLFSEEPKKIKYYQKTGNTKYVQVDKI